ncbi:MAG: DUF4097 domain-containing protein [Treponema sp.]|nr:DUF4097 domain-containing protein [Treponema sp.]
MKGKNILGAVWICIAILLTSILIGGMKKEKSVGVLHLFNKIDWDDEGRDDTDEIAEYEEEFSNLLAENSFASANIKYVGAELRTFPVEVSKSPDNQIYIKFDGGAEKFCNISTSNRRIIVKEKKGKHSPVNISRKVYISLPEAYNEHLEIESVSGSVRIKGIEASSAEVQSVSGSISISDCNINNTNVDAVSGSIQLNGEFKQISCESVSGSIKVESGCKLTQRSTFDSVSGSITLSIPSDSNYRVNYESMSGSFYDANTGIKGKKSGYSVNGSGDVQISIETVSGSIKIQ